MLFILVTLLITLVEVITSTPFSFHLSCPHVNHPRQVMTAASVPSTLVKCLYLFFDLPDTPDTGQLAQGEAEPEAEFTPRERRVLLQKMFMQVLC